MIIPCERLRCKKMQPGTDYMFKADDGASERWKLRIRS